MLTGKPASPSDWAADCTWLPPTSGTAAVAGCAGAVAVVVAALEVAPRAVDVVTVTVDTLCAGAAAAVPSESLRMTIECAAALACGAGCWPTTTPAGAGPGTVANRTVKPRVRSAEAAPCLGCPMNRGTTTLARPAGDGFEPATVPG